MVILIGASFADFRNWKGFGGGKLIAGSRVITNRKGLD